MFGRRPREQRQRDITWAQRRDGSSIAVVAFTCDDPGHRPTALCREYHRVSTLTPAQRDAELDEQRERRAAQRAAAARGETPLPERLRSRTTSVRL